METIPQDKEAPGYYVAKKDDSDEIELVEVDGFNRIWMMCTNKYSPIQYFELLAGPFTPEGIMEMSKCLDANKRLSENIYFDEKEIAELQAENRRLREALRKDKDALQRPCEKCEEPVYIFYHQDKLCNCCYIDKLREALETIESEATIESVKLAEIACAALKGK